MLLKVLDPGLYTGDDLRPAHPGDAGIDLRSRIDLELGKGDIARIPLGVAVDVESPYRYGMVGSRSSTLERFGLLTQEGKIDSGYRGEIHLIAYAIRGTHIHAGDRVAQLLVVEIANPDEWTITDSLEESERATAGFGSTGAA